MLSTNSGIHDADAPTPPASTLESTVIDVDTQQTTNNTSGGVFAASSAGGRVDRKLIWLFRHWLVALGVTAALLVGIVALLVALAAHKATTDTTTAAPTIAAAAATIAADTSVSNATLASAVSTPTAWDLAIIAAGDGSSWEVNLDYYRLKIQGGMNVSLMTYNNLQYAGRGYNLLYGSPFSEGIDPGFRKQIFTLDDYVNGEASADLTYLLPAGVQIQSSYSCRLDWESNFISSAYEYQEQLKTAVTASGTYGKYSFQASAEYQKVSKSTGSKSSLVTLSTAKCSVFHLTILPASPPPLDQYLLLVLYHALIAWNPTSNPFNPADVANTILDEFGTHYAMEIEMGSVFGQQSEISTATASSLDQTTLKTAVAGSAAGVAAASASVETDQSLGQQFASNCTRQHLYTIGGPPPANGDVLTWASQSLVSPAPIQLSNLQPLYKLLDPTSATYARYFTAYRSAAAALYQVLVDLIDNNGYCILVKQFRNNNTDCSPPQPPTAIKGTTFRGFFTTDNAFGQVQIPNPFTGQVWCPDGSTGELVLGTNIANQERRRLSFCWYNGPDPNVPVESVIIGSWFDKRVSQCMNGAKYQYYLGKLDLNYPSDPTVLIAGLTIQPLGLQDIWACSTTDFVPGVSTVGGFYMKNSQGFEITEDSYVGGNGLLGIGVWACPPQYKAYLMLRSYGGAEIYICLNQMLFIPDTLKMFTPAFDPSFFEAQTPFTNITNNAHTVNATTHAMGHSMHTLFHTTSVHASPTRPDGLVASSFRGSYAVEQHALNEWMTNNPFTGAQSCPEHSLPYSLPHLIYINTSATAGMEPDSQDRAILQVFICLTDSFASNEYDEFQGIQLVPLDLHNQGNATKRLMDARDALISPFCSTPSPARWYDLGVVRTAVYSAATDSYYAGDDMVLRVCLRFRPGQSLLAAGYQLPTIGTTRSTRNKNKRDFKKNMINMWQNTATASDPYFPLSTFGCPDEYTSFPLVKSATSSIYLCVVQSALRRHTNDEENSSISTGIDADDGTNTETQQSPPDYHKRHQLE